MPSILGLPMLLWLHLHRWPFLASHSAKTQLLSKAPSFLQNQYHLGVRRAWEPYKHELSFCTSGRSLSSPRTTLPVIFHSRGVSDWESFILFSKQLHLFILQSRSIFSLLRTHLEVFFLEFSGEHSLCKVLIPFFFLSSCMCVFVHLCMHMWRSAFGGQRLMWGILFILHQGYWDRVSQKEVELTDSVACLANQPQGSFYFHYLSHFDHRHMAPSGFLCEYLGFQLRSSCLPGKLYTNWAISPVPLFLFTCGRPTRFGAGRGENNMEKSMSNIGFWWQTLGGHASESDTLMLLRHVDG